MKILSTLSLLFFSLSLFSQGENKEWIFGEGVHLSFKTGKPVPVYDNPIIKTLEGSTSVSDANGNLLFYSDGLEVYDHTNARMPNGHGLRGHKSSTSSAVVVPYPKHPGKYYLFCVDQNLSTNNIGVTYNIIDMNANYKRGDVVTKNVVLQERTDEKIAVTSSCGKDGYWVVIHKAQTDMFMAYNITEFGLNTQPVISHCQTSTYVLPEIGYMKFSPTGRFMVNANTLSERLELFSFDKSTGKLELIAFDQTQYHRELNPKEQTYYGVAFSTEEKFFYVSTLESAEVFQYDMKDPSKVMKTKTMIAKLDLTAGAIQMGPDNMLYMTDGYMSHYIHRIEAPEMKGSMCKFNKNFIRFDDAVTLNIGLPTFIENSLRYCNLGKDIIIDYNSKKEITLDARIQKAIYRWSTGETKQTIQVTDTGGIFWVDTYDSNSCMYYTDTVRVWFSKPFKYNGTNVQDMVQCSNTFLEGTELKSKDNSQGYIWHCDNPFIGLPEYGRGNLPSIQLPYTLTKIKTLITIYPTMSGFVGKPIAISLTILPSPTIDSNSFKNENVCHRQPITYRRFIGLPQNKYIYVYWYNVDSMPGLADSGFKSIQNFLAHNTSEKERTYRIKLLAKDDNCPSLPYYYTYTTIPLPEMEPLVDLSFCNGDKLPVVELISNKNSKFAYSIPSKSGKYTEFDGDIWDAFPIPKTDEYFKEEVHVSPLYKGCYGDFKKFNLEIKPRPMAQFSSQLQEPDTVFSYAFYKVENQSQGFNYFVWNIDNENDSLNMIKDLKVPVNQPYNVQLICRNEYDCTDEYTMDFFIRRYPNLYVPNVFTPNSDQHNDFFKPIAFGMSSWDINVYNVWGELVYQGNQDSQMWDGTYKGLNCINGTYMWSCKSYGMDGKIYTHRGTLVLQR